MKGIGLPTSVFRGRGLSKLMTFNQSINKSMYPMSCRDKNFNMMDGDKA
jgi:hypothetical protein